MPLFKTYFSSLLTFIFFPLIGLGQKIIPPDNPSLKLVNSTFQTCDNTYNSYRFQNRISDLYFSNGHTFVTVQFSDDCCLAPQPAVFEKDSKYYLFSKTASDVYEECECRCCFSIQYEINQLLDTSYQFFFDQREIKPSEYVYPLKKESYELYKGDTINRKNAYGFHVGSWLSFFENGSLRSELHYPNTFYHQQLSPTKALIYYPSGNLKMKFENDTSKTWFENGSLQRIKLSTNINDTVIEREISYFPNKQIQSYEQKGTYRDTFYLISRVFYENGKVKKYEYKKSHNEANNNRNNEFIRVIDEYFYKDENGKTEYTPDTTRTYNKSGLLKKLKYKNGSKEYYENGKLQTQIYRWGPQDTVSNIIDNYMKIAYSKNGSLQSVYYLYTIKEIEYFEEEATWEWNQNQELITQPKNFKHPLPWIQFKNLSIPKLD